MHIPTISHVLLLAASLLSSTHASPTRSQSRSTLSPKSSSEPSVSVTACSTALTTPSTASSTSPTSQTSAPIAAAWMYLSDDLNYTTIPATWSKINFTTVDLLYIAPLGVQPDGTFNLYNNTDNGPLAHRFNWTIEAARKQNPAIKIVASQFWGGSPKRWGNDLSVIKTAQDIEKYASSVQAFMKKWEGVDGYDVDYEDTNVKANIGDIYRSVRSKLNQIDDGRKFLVTVSPAEATYLNGTASTLDYVNMQNYEGGQSLTIKDFLHLGFKSSQLLYGFDAERPEDGHSIKQVEKEYKWGKLAGIHVWRLDSSDWKAEGERQRQIAEFLHKGDGSNKGGSGKDDCEEDYSKVILDRLKQILGALGKAESKGGNRS